MRTRADMVADRLADGLTDGRIFLGAETGLAEHLIDGVGVYSTEELAQRIGPAVLRSAGDVERARRSERE